MNTANTVNNNRIMEANSRPVTSHAMTGKTELENIFNALGHERAQALLKQITPEISRRAQTLLSSVSAQDWAGAAHTAHKLLSTANLFASEQLIQNLIAIESSDMDTLQQTSFANTIDDQLKTGIDLLETYQTHQAS